MAVAEKTFGLAARYFDHLNVIAAFSGCRARSEALTRRCEEADRDPATLETSVLLTAIPDPNFTDDMIPPAMRGRLAVGSPARIAETVRTGARRRDRRRDRQHAQVRAGPIAQLGEALLPLLAG